MRTLNVLIATLLAPITLVTSALGGAPAKNQSPAAVRHQRALDDVTRKGEVMATALADELLSTARRLSYEVDDEYFSTFFNDEVPAQYSRQHLYSTVERYRAEADWDERQIKAAIDSIQTRILKAISTPKTLPDLSNFQNRNLERLRSWYAEKIGADFRAAADASDERDHRIRKSLKALQELPVGNDSLSILRGWNTRYTRQEALFRASLSEEIARKLERLADEYRLTPEEKRIYFTGVAERALARWDAERDKAVAGKPLGD